MVSSLSELLGCTCNWTWCWRRVLERTIIGNLFTQKLFKTECVELFASAQCDIPVRSLCDCRCDEAVPPKSSSTSSHLSSPRRMGAGSAIVSQTLLSKHLSRLVGQRGISHVTNKAIKYLEKFLKYGPRHLCFHKNQISITPFTPAKTVVCSCDGCNKSHDECRQNMSEMQATSFDFFIASQTTQIEIA